MNSERVTRQMINSTLELVTHQRFSACEDLMKTCEHLCSLLSEVSND
jgi:hypothetical protein